MPQYFQKRRVDFAGSACLALRRAHRAPAPVRAGEYGRGRRTGSDEKRRRSWQDRVAASLAPPPRAQKPTKDSLMSCAEQVGRLEQGAEVARRVASAGCQTGPAAVYCSDTCNQRAWRAWSIPLGCASAPRVGHRGRRRAGGAAPGRRSAAPAVAAAASSRGGDWRRLRCGGFARCLVELREALKLECHVLGGGRVVVCDGDGEVGASSSRCSGRRDRTRSGPGPGPLAPSEETDVL